MAMKKAEAPIAKTEAKALELEASNANMVIIPLNLVFSVGPSGGHQNVCNRRAKLEKRRNSGVFPFIDLKAPVNQSERLGNFPNI